MAYSEKQKYVPSNVNYTSKDFSSIKQDLIDYTKSYFPDTYKDFNETSPGMMLIELSSYVGDVLSYYIDYNYKENVLSTATEKRNVVRLAEFLGYKTNNITPSVVRLKVTRDVGVQGDNNDPDLSGLPLIDRGLQIGSNVDSNLIFETLDELDFTISGSPDVPDIGEPTSFDDNGFATGYTLTRFVNAISGETKTKTFTITTPTKFLELDLNETNVVEVIDCVDSSNQKWYEVPYLAQDRILQETHYSNDVNRTTGYSLGELSDDISAVSIPYSLEYIKTNKKFTKSVDPNTNTTKLQFGNGLYRYNVSGSSNSIFSVIEQQGINVSGVPMATINAAVDSLVANNSLNLGETPANTVLTIRYRVGGGANSNAQVGELTKVLNSTEAITVTNEEPASGGTDGQTVEEIKENAKSYFATQLRCVTKEDYKARILNLPSKFGNIAKAHVERSADGQTLVVRTLSYNQNKQLTQTPLLAFQNLRTYLNQFRMINDVLDFGFSLDPNETNSLLDDVFYSGHYINFGVNFVVNADRRFNPVDIKLETIEVIKDFFRIEKMQFRQTINLNDLQYNILSLDGVIGVKELILFQQDNEDIGLNTSRKMFSLDAIGNTFSDGESGYGFQYSFAKQESGGSLTTENIILPAVTPAVFELRNPNRDIYGRVV